MSEAAYVSRDWWPILRFEYAHKTTLYWASTVGFRDPSRSNAVRFAMGNHSCGDDWLTVACVVSESPVEGSLQTAFAAIKDAAQ